MVREAGPLSRHRGSVTPRPELECAALCAFFFSAKGADLDLTLPRPRLEDENWPRLFFSLVPRTRSRTKTARACTAVHRLRRGAACCARHHCLAITRASIRVRLS